MSVSDNPGDPARQLWRPGKPHNQSGLLLPPGVRELGPVISAEEKPIRFGRGAFLGMAALGAAGLAFGSAFNPLSSVTSTLSASVLPIDGFRIYTVISGYPTIKASTYQLRIDGLVDTPLTLSLSDILNMPAVQEVRTYQCVTGWVVNNVHWQGISLRHVMNLVSPQSNAKYVSFYSADGVYAESLSMAQAQRSDVLLAYKLNERPLAVEQGFPIRLVVPGQYGYKYAKWVNRVSFAPTRLMGYWEQNGYVPDAYIGANPYSS